MENQPCRKSRSTCVCLRCLIDEVGDCDADVCRICHGEKTESEMPLMSPCDCKGSVRYVHLGCLLTWMETSGSLSCEICQFRYLTRLKLKPFKEWTFAGPSEEDGRFEVFLNVRLFYNLVCMFWHAVPRFYGMWYPADELDGDNWWGVLGKSLHLLIHLPLLPIVFRRCRAWTVTWRVHNSVVTVLENSGGFLC